MCVCVTHLLSYVVLDVVPMQCLYYSDNVLCRAGGGLGGGQRADSWFDVSVLSTACLSLYDQEWSCSVCVCVCAEQLTWVMFMHRH